MKTYFSGTQKSSIWAVLPAPGAVQTPKIYDLWVPEKIGFHNYVLDVSPHSFFICFVRGPRFWALGLDSGPRGGAFEGVWDPRNKNKK